MNGDTGEKKSILELMKIIDKTKSKGNENIQKRKLNWVYINP